MDIHLITRHLWLLSALERDVQMPGVHIASRLGQLNGASLASQLEKISQGILLLEDATLAEDADWEALTALTHAQSAHLHVILLSHDPRQDVLVKAMRAGIREVLPCPPGPAEMHAAINRLLDLQPRPEQGSPSPKPAGQLMAFMACKGGAGATFVATTIAHMTVRDFHRSCAFIDLDLQYGDASFYLGSFEHPNTIADVAGPSDRLDAQLLSSCMYSVSPSLQALAAPPSVAMALNISAQHIEALLSLACTEHPLVVLDVPRSLDALSLKALDMADQVCLVMDNTMAALRDAKRLLKLFESLSYGSEKLRLFINKLPNERDLDRKGIEASLGLPIRYCIPEQPEAVQECINLGQAIGQVHPQNPVAIALRKATADLLGQPLPTPQGWITRWFGRSPDTGSSHTAGASLETRHP